MAEYRIDDLARASGVSVRNVRYYQDCGMLPPPRRRGRVSIYSEAHLARLRLVTRLLSRGYTAANIIELVTAWEQGRDLSDILGLEQVVTGFMNEEQPGYLTSADIHELFALSELESSLVEQVVEAGLAAPDGDRYRVASPRLLHAVAELIRTGAPLAVVLELSGQLLRSVDSTVRTLIGAISMHLLHDRSSDWLPEGGEIPELAKLADKIKPLAETTVSAALNLSFERHVEDIIGEHVARIMPHLAARRHA